MSWSVAIIVMVVLNFLDQTILALIDVRGKVAQEEAKGKYGEQYRMLADDFEKLAKENALSHAGDTPTSRPCSSGSTPSTA